MTTAFAQEARFLTGAELLEKLEAAGSHTAAWKRAATAIAAQEGCTAIEGGNLLNWLKTVLMRGSRSFESIGRPNRLETGTPVHTSCYQHFLAVVALDTPPEQGSVHELIGLALLGDTDFYVLRTQCDDPRGNCEIRIVSKS